MENCACLDCLYTYPIIKTSTGNYDGKSAVDGRSGAHHDGRGHRSTGFDLPRQGIAETHPEDALCEGAREGRAGGTREAPERSGECRGAAARSHGRQRWWPWSCDDRPYCKRRDRVRDGGLEIALARDTEASGQVPSEAAEEGAGSRRSRAVAKWRRGQQE